MENNEKVLDDILKELKGIKHDLNIITPLLIVFLVIVLLSIFINSFSSI